jgi:protoheme IX farnesyltransferase
VAIAAGTLMLALAWRVRTQAGTAGERAAKQLFGFSILYLVLLFSALLVEGLSGAFGRAAA